MPKTVIGIDPGLKGGIAILQGSDLKRVEKTPIHSNKQKTYIKAGTYDYDYEKMVEILAEYKNEKPIAFLERVHSMPKQGVASTFNFGRGYGVWIGMLEAMHIPIALVSPRVWKPKMLSGLDQSNKQSSCIRAKEFFPEADLKPGRMINDHDGMAEAMLIAIYGGMQVWR